MLFLLLFYDRYSFMDWTGLDWCKIEPSLICCFGKLPSGFLVLHHRIDSNSEIFWCQNQSEVQLQFCQIHNSLTLDLSLDLSPIVILNSRILSRNGNGNLVWTFILRLAKLILTPPQASQLVDTIRRRLRDLVFTSLSKDCHALSN